MKRRRKQTKEKRFYLPLIIVFGISLLPLLTMGREKDNDSEASDSTPAPLPKTSGKKHSKQKNRAGHIFYLTVVLFLCLMPLLAIWLPTGNGTVENRTLAALPIPFNEEGFHWNYLQEMGEYFNDHFAFRSELVTLDALIRTSVFGVSPVSDVIAGENGWLYYTATLDDFQHNNPVSDRILFNIAHNLSLMQQYTESLGVEFLFTVAPNKNSLYGENMPQKLQYQFSAESDMERLLFWLEKEQVNYVDLFSLFREQDEILYYQRDSHWNQKGAVMVYNTLLDTCGKPHETYENHLTQITNDFYGDLNQLLFPAGARPETDIRYTGGSTWTYSQGETVEDSLIITECEGGSQTLLMYRDSFGNSLIPFLSEEFSQAIYSKNVPYTMTDIAAYWPDLLIVERVERHLPTLDKVPPLMSAPETALDGVRISVDSYTTINLSKEGSYWKITGIADMEYLSTDSRIFMEITDADSTKIYEAFCTSLADDGLSDYGFTLYISEIMVSGDSLNLKTLTQRDDEIMILNEDVVTLVND